jgi:hypothetical protein
VVIEAVLREVAINEVPEADMVIVMNEDMDEGEV